MGKNVGKDVGGSVSIIAIAGFKLGNIVGVTVLLMLTMKEKWRKSLVSDKLDSMAN